MTEGVLNILNYTISDIIANNEANKATAAVFVLELHSSVDLAEFGISANTNIIDPLTNMTYTILQLAVVAPSSEHACMKFLELIISHIHHK